MYAAKHNVALSFDTSVRNMLVNIRDVLLSRSLFEFFLISTFNGKLSSDSIRSYLHMVPNWLVANSCK